MNLTKVILGEIVTEKAERLKTRQVATMQIHPDATKVDVKNALRRYYGLESLRVRIVQVQPKVRAIARGKTAEKRHRSKRAFVTLAPKSKPFDSTAFQS